MKRILVIVSCLVLSIFQCVKISQIVKGGQVQGPPGVQAGIANNNFVGPTGVNPYYGGVGAYPYPVRSNPWVGAWPNYSRPWVYSRRWSRYGRLY